MTVAVGLRPALGEGASPLDRAADAARRWAPYLRRALDAFGEADFLAPESAQRIVAEATAEAVRIAQQDAPFDEGMRALRLAKRRLHLALALADLAGLASLDDVTRALTDFADAAVKAALAMAARTLAARGDFSEADPGVRGLTIIAMGKMGAHELNYSSDIDISVFYEPAALPVAPGREPRQIAQRVVSLVVRALEEITADGYVFRTDLRLRPDPASTPPAVTLAAAEQYYQSLGQNWERAAFIKARVCAGDTARGEAFLASLHSYVWRRHLDYAAVSDVLAIKRQIIAAKSRADLDDPKVDVKLGRGGIRDIELFAQTQQLIHGGRNPDLRRPRTHGALRALHAAGHIDAATCAALSEAYAFYRGVEHRIQMREDAQTHTTPVDAEARGALAAMCGFETSAAFDAALRTRRAAVIAADARFFGRFESLAAQEGSLIFTGVEDSPETLETLQRMGFKHPAAVSDAIRGWHHGRIRATRSERAREILTALTPTLLRAIAETSDPDAAFARFSSFLSGLSAGVTALSLLQAHPTLMQRLALAFASAPRLAQDLARRPALMDAMIEPDFFAPLDDAADMRADLDAAVSGAASFEAAINAARRLHRERAFRISMQVLTHHATAQAAGLAHADLADACVDALRAACMGDVARAHGAIDGACAVAALGKFGGRELSDGSDLDMMVIYDAADGVVSSGPREASAPEYFSRVTQRLISALSAPTEEGVLYAVDMQLRPSGSKGPVAVRLSSLARYYLEEAWTWELMALTRLRIASSDGDLAARICAARDAALRAPRPWVKVRDDALDMRARMARERPGRGLWDLKLAPGGFVDVEFIAQALQLRAAPDGGDVVRANTGAALQRLAAIGALPADAAETLIRAWTLYGDLQQILRIGLDTGDVAQAPHGLRGLLAAAGGVGDFAALEALLAETQAQCRALFTALIGPLGDGAGG
ncbi:MAG: bifunctional [glutamine synthetase] adenylyltransferase/[glutamine synthetase]-adenylyl-L-tyrosine phosphorylase [Hyphomonadaceae bacterium]|nr:bifunctional [glutamine synthetase] adenylyltransferase/[glutamine synthetase]-adenylyl-L-tyrosine phosphorylase [Hyphomonadaceae bacterium]